MKQIAARIFTLFMTAFVVGALCAEPDIEDATGKVIWPDDYELEVAKPQVLLADGKTYLPNVVQNLIGDELSLQRRALTRGRVSPKSIEYPLMKDHEHLPLSARAELLAKFRKPEIMPLRVVRSERTPGSVFSCDGMPNDRYVIASRIVVRSAKLRIEALLCQGSEPLQHETVAVDEQDLVGGVTKLVNPLRARLTGDVYATVKVASDPERASVYLDDLFIGKSPLVYSYLVPGNYTLVVKRDGYQAFSSPIAAQGGETVVRNVTIKKIHGGGAMDITSDPPGAKIYLDADYKGVTPKKLENLVLGTYRVHILAPKKGEVYRNVTLTEQNPAASIDEKLTEFMRDRQPGMLGISYKAWYWGTLTAAALSLGGAIYFYVWRDNAQEDIYARTSAKDISLYTSDDYAFIADRRAQYDIRQSWATGLTISAAFFAAASLYFYLQYLFSLDEGVVMRPQSKPSTYGDVDIRLGAMPGQTGLSANFRF